MRAASAAPRTVAGIFGMLLIAALFMANALSLRQRGAALGIGWLVLLTLPGVLAAHLSWRRGMKRDALMQGVMAGLLMAHFAAFLEVTLLVIAVLTTDWNRYAAQVGTEIAEGVREGSLPGAILVGAIVVVIVYAGCVLASWLGAAAYVLARRLSKY